MAARLAQLGPAALRQQMHLFPGVSLGDLVRAQAAASIERDALYRALESTPPGPERHELLARHAVAQAALGGLKCEVCFQCRALCWCAHARRCELTNKNTRVVIYMATNEYGKNCNSGHAVAATLGNAHCEVVVAGLREQEEALWERLRRPGGAVLYPDEASVTLSELSEWWLRQAEGQGQGGGGGGVGIGGENTGDDGGVTGDEGASSGNGSGGGRGGDGRGGGGGSVPVALHTLVAIDTTWQRSKALMRRIPPDVASRLPHVRLARAPLAAATEGHQHTDNSGAMCERSLLAPLRKNKCKEGSQRVCTLEAVAAMLLEMGEPQEVADSLHHNLRWRVDSSLAQKNRPQPYGMRQKSAAEGGAAGAANANADDVADAVAAKLTICSDEGS